MTHRVPVIWAGNACLSKRGKVKLRPMASDPNPATVCDQAPFSAHGWCVRAQGKITLQQFANKMKETKTFAKQLMALAEVPVARPSYVTTLKFKIQPNAWPWLDQAAREVNQVWNWANATSWDAIRGPRSAPKWLSAVDLDALCVGASECFARIGSDVVQRVNAEYVGKRNQFRKAKLRWRRSGGSKRALGWIPFKAANLRVKGECLTFSGKSIRLFQMDRFLEFRNPSVATMRGGNFAQNALGEWFLNVTFHVFYPEGTVLTEQGLPMLEVAPNDTVGIDPGLKTVWTTSKGKTYPPNRSYRTMEGKISTAQKRGHKRQAKRWNLKVANQRLDYNHQTSYRVAKEHQTIYIGNLSWAFLSANHKAKSAHDAAPGMLKSFVMYKGHRTGRTVKEVCESWTTQVCSACQARTGPKGRDMLVVRRWVCSACHAEHDRDINAAINIEKRGQDPLWGWPPGFEPKGTREPRLGAGVLLAGTR
jgi:putative transposase